MSSALTLLRERGSGATAVEIDERGHRVRVHGRVHQRAKISMRTSAPEPGTSSCRLHRKATMWRRSSTGSIRPQGGTDIISCASCTTNCITPVMEILGRRIGVKKAIMTTIHAYTASQAIVDAPHNARPKRPGGRREYRSHIHRRGGRDHQGAARVSWPIRWCGRPCASPCRLARRHRRDRRQTDDRGRGEPCVHGRGRGASAIAGCSA